MPLPPVISGLVLLLGLQLVGETVVRLLGVSFPGAVVGLVLFLVVLRIRRPPEESALVQAPLVLLRHLQLLFVPAGVGVVASLTALRDNAAAVTLGLVVSWLLGLIAAGATMTWLIRRQERIR